MIRKLMKKIPLGTAALAVILLLTVGGTTAFLLKTTGSLVNTFTPAEISCYVDEEFNGTVKENVKIQNTGDVDAYIRAAVVVNWVMEDGTTICARHAARTIPASVPAGWVRGDDGFYYCTQKIAPGAFTPVLIESATLSAAEDGCRMQVEILASAIQAEPFASCDAAWEGVQGNA